MKPEIILGLHGFSADSPRQMHDAGVCLLVDGEVAAAIDDDKNYLPIGALAPDIELPDQNGHTTYLSEIPAKLVLVDFWTSGCCRCCC